MISRWRGSYSEVPEPSALALGLAGLGAIGLAGLRGRRRRG
ncbi:MAG: PEP-CTERM sorting domain-containing protein [Burkholderiaceae bacterium]|nr:PEP-CTERM sorting domain-containing protein [Burkholderiaceae bacterium]